MRPWNPHSQTFHGEPIVGQVPVRVVVHGPPMTPQQSAMLHAAYTGFAACARLSIVQNPNAQGILPDGSRYAINCVNGVCACTVWPVGGGAEPGEAYPMAHGVLRDRGWSYPPDDPGYRELKSVGKTTYEITDKFTYVKPPDIEYGPISRWFYSDATGAMKTYSQFVAGANAGYCAYLTKKGVIPRHTKLGTGIVAFGSGANQRVYFYSYEQGAIRAIRATVVPARSIVEKGSVPAEILSRFGGCPIPPTEQQWDSLGYTALPQQTITAAIGWEPVGTVNGFSVGLFGARSGTSFSLPQQSVSDDGKNMYFVARKEVDTADEYKRSKSRPVTITFSETEVGGVQRLSATAQATHYEGVVGYVPKGIFGYIEGITKGICAVGLFNSTPTYFETELLAADNGNGGIEGVEAKVNISGGITKSGVVYSRHMWGEPTMTGSFSASITYRQVGTFDHRVTVGGYVYGATGEIWEKVWSASVTEKTDHLEQDRLVIVGSDGAIQISEPHLASSPSRNVDCSANTATPLPYYTTTSYNGPSPPNYYPPFAGVPEFASGTIVQSGPKWFETAAWVLTKPTGGELGGRYPYASSHDDEEIRKLAALAGLLPQYTHPPESASGIYILAPPDVTPGNSTIYAGDGDYSVNTMQVLTDYTTDDQLKTVRNSAALLSINPLYCVPPKGLPGYVYYPSVLFYAFSHLGTRQIICRYSAWNHREAQEYRLEMNHGALVVGDSDYGPNVNAYFVGKT